MQEHGLKLNRIGKRSGKIGSSAFITFRVADVAGIFAICGGAGKDLCKLLVTYLPCVVVAYPFHGKIVASPSSSIKEQFASLSLKLLLGVEMVVINQLIEVLVACCSQWSLL